MMEPFATFGEVRRWAWFNKPQGPFGFLILSGSGKAEWVDDLLPFCFTNPRINEL